MHKRVILRAAEVALHWGHAIVPHNAGVIYRLGRVRERLKNLKGAEAAYSAGVDLAGPTLPKFLARRAEVRSRRRHWAAAIADCTAHPDVKPPRQLLPRLAQNLRTNGQVDDAFATLQPAIDHKPDGNLLAALAECYEYVGDFDSAISAYRRAIGIAPNALDVRTNLGRLYARRSLVPFDASTDPPSRMPDELTKEALTNAIEELEGVLQASASRTWAAYDLGRVLESQGLLNDAFHAYDTAISRVEQVDKPWAHNAAQAWRFRRAYVKRRISEQSGDEPDEPRLNRTIKLGSPCSDMSGVAGFFETTITNTGLLVEGSVLQGHRGSVEIYVDGNLIMAVTGDGNHRFRTFKTTIVHNVLREFPHESTLTLHVDGASLATISGAQAVTVTIPGGSDRLSELLLAGHSVNKKGRWSAKQDTSDVEAQLEAYETARMFFADELGIRLFVSYGTLLGCYRDGRPIPGDDDFDVSFVADATSPDALKAEVLGVVKTLLRGGFDSRVAVDGRMFHLRAGDVALDVNPFWFFDGRAWAFASHALGRDVFAPVGSIDVAGFEVDVPAKPETFLKENYGPDWRTPRSDFQYHRAKSDRAVLRRAFLVPSEVRDLQVYAAQLATEIPSPGKFHGYGDPGDPRFR